MEVTLALLADAANVSQEGKLNILGEFDTLFAPAFPARHPQMQLVMRFEASAAEYGTTKNLEIKLIGEDGELHGGAQGQVVVPADGQGRRVKLQHILGLRDVTFPTAGDYVFAIMLDGRTEREVAVQLVVL